MISAVNRIDNETGEDKQRKKREKGENGGAQHFRLTERADEHTAPIRRVAENKKRTQKNKKYD